MNEEKGNNLIDQKDKYASFNNEANEYEDVENKINNGNHFEKHVSNISMKSNLTYVNNKDFKSSKKGKIFFII